MNYLIHTYKGTFKKWFSSPSQVAIFYGDDLISFEVAQ